MLVPHDQKRIVPWLIDVIGKCRSSAGARMALARALRQWKLAGSNDGSTAIYNKIDSHVDRLASYLFSPSELRFHIDFEMMYPSEILRQAEVASRVLSREWERRDIDMQFAEAVKASLTYGSCFLKQMWSHNGLTARLVMPWAFGVYREDLNDLQRQEAMCETTYITVHELWRRIAHLPNAVELYKRARMHARRSTNGGDDTGSYFHNVVLAGSSPTVQTQAPFNTQPGGFVDVTSDYSSAIIAPEVAEELIAFHEVWVIDDARGDYTTLQLVEPDILIAPLYRRINLFIEGSQTTPYTLIQANRQDGYLFGRSEVVPLMRLQALLRDRMEDIKKLMSIQYDRLFAFSGYAMNDEMYDQFRHAGWISNDQPGGKVEDLTPPLPENAFTDIETIIKFMDEISGFQNILSGQGEPGVRAGNHAQTLMRTASPRLRDRALLVERQCGETADKSYQLMAAKEARAYWPEPTMDTNKDFLLSQLPDDFRIVVDSHSSSPVYEADNTQLAFALAKLQAIDGESLIDLLPLPLKDLLKERYRVMQQKKAQFIQEHPEVLTKGKGASGKH